MTEYKIGDRFVVLEDARSDSGQVPETFAVGDVVEIYLGIDLDGDVKVRKPGTRYGDYILPKYLEKYNATKVTPGSRVRAVSVRGDGERWADVVGKVGTVAQESFYDTTCRVAFDGGPTRAAFTDNLQVITDDAAKPEAPLPDRIRDAWKVGNVIQFTVKADFTQRYDETLVVVGCKEPSLAGVAESIVSMDKTTGMVTFEADITFNGWNGDGVHKHGQSIILSEALDWFKDVKVVKEAAPKRQDISLTITPDEADALYAVTGRCAGSSPTTRIFGILNDSEGVNKTAYSLASSSGTGIPVIQIKKN